MRRRHSSNSHSRAFPVLPSSGLDQAASRAYAPTHPDEAAIRFRTSEALLLRAEQLASLGCWEVDVQARKAYCSGQLYRLLGFEPESGPVSLESVLQLIHPEDREKVRAKFLASVEKNQPYENETRYLLPDNRVRILHARALPVADSSGHVVRVVGVSQDVTDQKEAEEKLRRSEALLAQAEQLARLGSWEYDVERKSFTWSDQMYRMLGRPPGEGPVSLEEACAIFHPEDRARVWQDVLGIISEGHSLENELRFMLPDGQVRIFHSRAVPVKNTLGVVHHIRGMSQDITERKRAEEELRRLSHQLLNIRDDERRRIARELHESAAQTLAALKLTLARLADFVPLKDEHGRQLVASSLQLTEDAIQEIRTLSDLMHPPMLDLVGLGPALRWFAAGFSQRAQIHVQVEIVEDFGRLPQETETAVFRIVQEALTNIYRHSASRSAAVRVSRQENSIHVLIEDQGHGFVFPSGSATPNALLGSGLAAIRERVKQLNGEFDIQSAPGKGATLSVILPLPEDQLG